MRAVPPPAQRTLSVVELRAERDRARSEYLTAARQRSYPRGTKQRARLWRAFVEANAAYIRAKGETR